MKLSKKELIISASIGFTIVALYIVRSVLQSTNSTAVVGFIFIPWYGSIGAIASIVSYYLIKRNWWTRLFFIVVVAFTSFGFYEKNEYVKSATDPNTPASYLVDLAQAKMLFSNEEVLLALAKNTSSPPELLQKLSENKSGQLKTSVAANPATSLDVLLKLSKEKYNYSLHAALVSNKKITPEIIEHLLIAKPSDFNSETEYKLYQTYVFGPLARNPLLTEENFLKLTQIQNPEYFLIYGIIQSGRASCDLLKSYRDGDNGALKTNASWQMDKQGCAK